MIHGNIKERYENEKKHRRQINEDAFSAAQLLVSLGRLLALTTQGHCD